ncbi:helix-turn-helix transcriptional regulator [Corynebacterium sp.]|uniref:helix-turn-helix domain-containing protein n=1 Tax=Corynebacterium sp. TaxID=1720 RepID=UPI0025C431E5|nr:helix-turn-helix transcriptional regulator [Corynebacterium sp.]
MNHAQKIGQYLAYIRKQKGLSQSIVATEAMCSSSSLSEMEADASKARFNAIALWAAALRVDLADLIAKLNRGEDIMPTPPALEYHGRTYVRADLRASTVLYEPGEKVRVTEVSHATA